MCRQACNTGGTVEYITCFLCKTLAFFGSYTLLWCLYGWLSESHPAIHICLCGWPCVRHMVGWTHIITSCQHKLLRCNSRDKFISVQRLNSQDSRNKRSSDFCCACTAQTPTDQTEVHNQSESHLSCFKDRLVSWFNQIVSESLLNYCTTWLARHLLHSQHLDLAAGLNAAFWHWWGNWRAHNGQSMWARQQPKSRPPAEKLSPKRPLPPVWTEGGASAAVWWHTTLVHHILQHASHR